MSFIKDNTTASHLLLPSTIICSCQKRFDSSWSSSSSSNNTHRRRLASVDSALWLFLRHRAARLSSRRAPASAHCAVKLLFRCASCSKSVDIGEYREHVRRRCPTTIELLRETSSSSPEEMPSFECCRCVERGEVDNCRFDLPNWLEHSHRFAPSPTSRRVAEELCVTCGECRVAVALGDAIAHAAYWHRDRLDSSSALADLFVTRDEEILPDPIKPDCRVSSTLLSDPMRRRPDPDCRISSALPDPISRRMTQPLALVVASESHQHHEFSDVYQTAGTIVQQSALQNPPAAQPTPVKNRRTGGSFECENCGQATFATQEDLRLHAQHHARARPFRCTVCGRTYPTEKIMRAHRRLHFLERNHSCSECNMRFFSKSAVKRHARKHIEPSERAECPLCSLRVVDVDRHFRIVHSSIDKRHQCPQCGKSFRVYTVLQDHMRIHTGERPHQCPYYPECNQRFGKRATLDAHVVFKHTNAGRFACADCHKTFHYNSQLTLHRRTHTGERRYPCPQCDKRFSTETRRRRHLLHHGGIRSFRCEPCGKGFVSRGNLEQHRRTRGHRALVEQSAS